MKIVVVRGCISCVKGREKLGVRVGCGGRKNKRATPDLATVITLPAAKFIATLDRGMHIIQSRPLNQQVEIYMLFIA